MTINGGLIFCYLLRVRYGSCQLSALVLETRWHCWTAVTVMHTSTQPLRIHEPQVILDIALPVIVSYVGGLLCKS